MQARRENASDSPVGRKSDGKATPGEVFSEEETPVRAPIKNREVRKEEASEPSPVAQKNDNKAVLAKNSGGKDLQVRASPGCPPGVVEAGKREPSVDSVTSKSLEENHRGQVQSVSKVCPKVDSKARGVRTPPRPVAGVQAPPSSQQVNGTRDPPLHSNQRAQPYQGGQTAMMKAPQAAPVELRPNGTNAERQEPHGAVVNPQQKAVADRLVWLPKSGPPKSAPHKRAEPIRPTDPPEHIASRPSPSSSSRAPVGGKDKTTGSVRVYPEQLVTQDVGGALDEYAQFVCKICNLIVHSPLVLPCAHMFCSGCFGEWVHQKRPNVTCPTCRQVVGPREVVHFESKSSTPGGGALALLYRLYSGMKVSCVYHSDLGNKPLTAEAAQAKASGRSCNWRGAMHDYPNHLNSCEVHASVASQEREQGEAPLAAPPITQSPFQSECQALVTGFFQISTPWHPPEAGTPHLQRGTILWVTSSADERGEWALARIVQPRTIDSAAWVRVPRTVIQRAVYRIHQKFNAEGQAQLSLNVGDEVHVYRRETSGWTMGARLDVHSSDARATPGEVGWFPERCIAEPLPVA